MEVSKIIHVTVAVNKAQLGKRFEKLVTLLDKVEVIKIEHTFMDAIETVSKAKPEVMIIDINLPDLSGIELIDMVRKRSSWTQVVVIAPEKKADEILSALRAGASDYLTYEADLEEFKAAITKAGQLSFGLRKETETFSPIVEGVKSKTIDIDRDKSRGSIITVYSAKGGTGVTSLAVNLAIALQDGENTVAMVDGDMQFGDVGLFLNQTAPNSVTDLVDHINDLDKKMIDDVMVLHKVSGLYLLTAPLRPEYADRVNGDNFSTVLDYLRYIFNYVVVNTSSHISDPCLAALDSGDVIVLVTSQDIASIWGTRMFLDLWENLGMNKKRIMLTLNRYQKKITITPQKIGERLKLPVAATLDEDDAVSRSANLGIPHILNNREAPFSQNITVLANTIYKKSRENMMEDRFRLFENHLIMR